MKKLILILTIFATLFINITPVFADIGGGNDKLVSIEPGTADLIFNVISTPRTMWTYLIWETSEYYVEVVGDDGTKYIGTFNYKQAGAGKQTFDVPIYDEGERNGVGSIESACDKGFSDYINTHGGTIKLSPHFNVLHGINPKYLNGVPYYEEYAVCPGGTNVLIDKASTFSYGGVQFDGNTKTEMQSRFFLGRFGNNPAYPAQGTVTSHFCTYSEGVTCKIANDSTTPPIPIPPNQSVTKTVSALNLSGYRFVGSGFTPSQLSASRDITVTLNASNPSKEVYFIYEAVPQGAPTLGIQADPTSVGTGESYSVIDACIPSQAATKITSWTVKEEFIPEGGGARQVLQNKTVTNRTDFFKSYIKSAAGLYIYTITSITDDKGLSASGNVSANVMVRLIPPSPRNEPPHAIILSPDTVKAGDDITYNGAASYDIDGRIVSYDWVTPGAGVSISGASGTTYYTTVGEKDVSLTVTDDSSYSDTATKKITVLPPIPEAVIHYTGKLKENRKITVDSLQSTSPKRYPINLAQTTWQFVAVSGCSTSDIKYQPGLTGIDTKAFIVKKAGLIKITLTIRNTAGYSATATLYLNIEPDLAPVADITNAARSLRSIIDVNGHAYSIVELYDMSYSPDGDTVKTRTWVYRYDSDNDGSYADETSRYGVTNITGFSSGNTLLINGSNDVNPKLYSYDVGKYDFGITVQEDIPDTETLKEFLVPADYKSATVLEW